MTLLHDSINTLDDQKFVHTRQMCFLSIPLQMFPPFFGVIIKAPLFLDMLSTGVGLETSWHYELDQMTG